MRQLTPQEIRAHAWVQFCGRPMANLFKWGSLAVISFPLSSAVVALAGKNTNVNVVAKGAATYSETTADLTTCDCSVYLIPIILAFCFGAVCLFQVYRERQLKKKVIEEKSSRIIELEEMVDAGRTSSGLTTEGETNPEDL